jgi:hypothetical protein
MYSEEAGGTATSALASSALTFLSSSLRRLVGQQPVLWQPSKGCLEGCLSTGISRLTASAQASLTSSLTCLTLLVLCHVSLLLRSSNYRTLQESGRTQFTCFSGTKVQILTLYIYIAGSAQRKSLDLGYWHPTHAHTHAGTLPHIARAIWITHTDTFKWSIR